MTHAYAGKILRVDLSKGKSKVGPLDTTLTKMFLGGKGFGAKLLSDLVGPKTDPFGPDNLILYCTGPLTATLAPANRCCIVTKSPLTGLFSDSYAGGHFGQELKYAGYDILVISGKARSPVYLWADDEKVEIKQADHLWGQDTYQTYDTLKREMGDHRIKISCVGPAGERKVRFALVDCDYHRQAARCGTGAVMGSKNLKAIAVRGSGEISVADPKAFDESVRTCYQEINANPSVMGYKTGGTVGVCIGFSNEQGLFPTRNFQDGFFEKYSNIDDAGQRKHIWLREYGCFACPTHCSKVGMIQEGPYSGEVCDEVEYETTGLLGGSCAIDTVTGLAYANLLCDKLGLDSISTGNVIGFAMECYEKGILSREDTEGLELNFGNSEAQIELIKKIAYREGLGDILAEGVMRAAARIGKAAEDLAVHIKGMEAPAWGPRGSPGEGLALATSDRGCDHQKAFPVAYEVWGASPPAGSPLERLATKGKAGPVKWEQDYLSWVFSLVICDIGRTGISNGSLVKMLSTATGWDVKFDGLMECGERIWNLIRMFNVREGIGRKEDSSLPKRFKEPLPSGPAKGHKFTDEEFDEMLNEYYAVRGWDEGGKPTQHTLARLKLENVR